MLPCTRRSTFSFPADATDGDAEPLRVRVDAAWTGWGSWPLSAGALAVAATVVVLDLASAWSGLLGWQFGRVTVSPALPPAALLVALLTLAKLRRQAAAYASPSWWAWREFLACVALVGALGSAVVARAVGTRRELVGIVVAVVSEELVFRVAVILVAGAVCAALLGRPWRDTASWGTGPATVGIATGALSFTLLPGHVAQVTGWSTAVPFASLAALLGYAVLRTGTVLPAIAAHLWLDLVVLGQRGGALPAAARAPLSASVLVALVAGLMLAGRRLGIRRSVTAEIDLRAPARPASPSLRSRGGGGLLRRPGAAVAVPRRVARDLRVARALDVGSEL